MLMQVYRFTKSEQSNFNFIISQPKHMMWALKELSEAPKTYVKIEG